MHFDLNGLLQPIENLEVLQSPFSQVEIDNIVKDLPLEKSLGLDGFNSDFMKKCWMVISQDIYELWS
jgi:hypothetical protein